MRLHQFAFIFLSILPLATYGQSESFNRFNEEMPQLLETDATTVMVRALTHDFAKRLCARLGPPVAQMVEIEVDEWRKRNDLIISGAAKALNEFSDRHLPIGGEDAKQEYLQMILRTSIKTANDRVMRQLNGATLDNNIVPPFAACVGLSRMLHDGVGDFEKTPEVTQALVVYMQRKSKP